MGERASSWRNRSTSTVLDTRTATANSATVHSRAGSACSSDRAGPTTGSRSAASHPVSSTSRVSCR